MSKKNIVESSILSAAVIGIVVLLNLLGVNSFFRVDLTEGGQYTLSEASQDAVRGLADRLTIRAYFSEGLPAPYSSNARYVKDLLDEYYAASDGSLSYEFLDPLAEESEEDKETRKEVQTDIFGRQIRQETEVERELRSLGIQPVEVRVNEGDALEVKRVYMGISLRYGDDKEAIPVVTDTARLEYDLTTLIRKITRTRVPKIGIITGREGYQLGEDLSTLNSLLGQQYQVDQVELSGDEPSIPEDVDAIIVTGPKQPFTPEEADAIDAFVRSGRAAAFLLDALRVDLRTTNYEPANHGLGQLIASYGVRILPGLLLDAQCASINVTQQRGFMRIAQPVQYPYLPVVRQLDQNHPLTRGLADVSFPFTSALEVVNTEDGLQAEVLVSSSDQSWIKQPPYDLNPLQRWPAEIEFDGPHPLVVALAGRLGAGQAEAASDEESSSVPSSRILVVGGASLITDQFMAATTQALALNLVDWLLMDEAMAEIRARGLQAAPLEELSDSKRNFLKYGNIIGIPLIFALIGIIRWRLRESRRAAVTV